MAEFIVCHKKRNTPRINVRICQAKCPQKNECKDFLSHMNGAGSGKNTQKPEEGLVAASAGA